MSRVCAVTGRRTRIGHKVKRRGLAKRDGGVGRRVTGRSKRTFKPNIQPVRILTPEEALEAGADYLVIGRPITGSRDPAAAAKSILATIR